MDEMEKYRARINRKWANRRTGSRYGDGGRRKEDYKSPPFFTVGFTVQFLTVLISCLVVLVALGCSAIKRTLLRG